MVRPIPSQACSYEDPLLTSHSFFDCCRASAGRARTVRTGPSQFDAPSSTSAPSYKLPEDRKPRVGDEEEYSDQEGGVEIVDMADLETLDVMAPTALRRDREVKKEKKVNKEALAEKRGKGKSDALTRGEFPIKTLARGLLCLLRADLGLSNRFPFASQERTGRQCDAFLDRLAHLHRRDRLQAGLEKRGRHDARIAQR